ncbi:MAG: DNA repair protein RecO [Acidimicrobiales bacterium]
MANYRDTGVVLRTIRLGEADRIVTILTPEHGKVRAVAKGVRKVKSRIGARLEPLTHVDVLCWRGRELDIVTQVEVIDVFRGIRSDLARLGPAMTMLEIVDQVTVDHQGSPALYTLLVGALRSIEVSASPVTLAAFCLRLLTVEGVGPVTDRCAHCGRAGPLVAFDAGEGGFLCHSCRRGQAVSAEVVALAQRICSGGLARALTEPEGPTVDALERIATSAVEHHLDRRLRTTRHHLAEETTPA